MSASAREVSGVEVPETLSVTQQPLQLNGAAYAVSFLWICM
ncbi:MAG: chalcone isomerase family protein [Shewanella fodinae]|nr:chalcone isomerase family protein [Shewanella fodinae]